MQRGLIKALGVVLLLATVGIVSCQALFADGPPIDHLPPPAVGAPLTR